MSADADMPKLERVTFFDGQRLTAADLEDIQRHDRELRWLHNRSLHMWGIGLGLEVTGAKGDREVKVAPGYAVDCRGREIVLMSLHTEPVPPVAGAQGGGEAEYYLTIAYARDQDLDPTEEREGLCASRGAIRLPEEPKLAWCEPGELKPDIELVLAQIWVLNCQLSRPVSLEPRRNARPASQPYIAAGRTEPGGTEWRFWPSDAEAAERMGVEAQVDTSAARFRLTPRYLARVEGERYLSAAEEEEGGPPQPLLLEGFASVGEATRNAFELRVLMPRGLWAGRIPINPWEALNEEILEWIKDDLRWHVVWMGVEG